LSPSALPPAHNASRTMDIDLNSLSRKELQALAKENGVKANGKSAVIIEQLSAIFAKEHAEAEAAVDAALEDVVVEMSEPATTTTTAAAAAAAADEPAPMAVEAAAEAEAETQAAVTEPAVEAKPEAAKPNKKQAAKKATAPKKPLPTNKLHAVAKPATSKATDGSESTTTKKAPKAPCSAKKPDFAKIHERQFAKQTAIKDTKEAKNPKVAATPSATPAHSKSRMSASASGVRSAVGSAVRSATGSAVRAAGSAIRSAGIASGSRRSSVSALNKTFVVAKSTKPLTEFSEFKLSSANNSNKKPSPYPGSISFKPSFSRASLPGRILEKRSSTGGAGTENKPNRRTPVKQNRASQLREERIRKTKELQNDRRREAQQAFRH